MSRTRMQTIGERIKQAREAKGLSIRQLAKEVGISFSLIAKLEAGDRGKQPTGQTLMKLSRALDIELEDLYALAGYAAPDGLPEFGPYLRAKYGLSTKAIEELEQAFGKVEHRKHRGGRRGRTTY